MEHAKAFTRSGWLVMGPGRRTPTRSWICAVKRTTQSKLWLSERLNSAISRKHDRPVSVDCFAIACRAMDGATQSEVFCIREAGDYRTCRTIPFVGASDACHDGHSAPNSTVGITGICSVARQVCRINISSQNMSGTEVLTRCGVGSWTWLWRKRSGHYESRPQS
jgi:hypothetical protein